jgi:hypothetical protein
VCTEHERKELMRALSIGIRNFALLPSWTGLQPGHRVLTTQDNLSGTQNPGAKKVSEASIAYYNPKKIYATTPTSPDSVHYKWILKNPEILYQKIFYKSTPITVFGSSISFPNTIKN